MDIVIVNPISFLDNAFSAATATNRLSLTCQICTGLFPKSITLSVIILFAHSLAMLSDSSRSSLSEFRLSKPNQLGRRCPCLPLDCCYFPESIWMHQLPCILSGPKKAATDGRFCNCCFKGPLSVVIFSWLFSLRFRAAWLFPCLSGCNRCWLKRQWTLPKLPCGPCDLVSHSE